MAIHSNRAAFTTQRLFAMLWHKNQVLNSGSLERGGEQRESKICTIISFQQKNRASIRVSTYCNVLKPPLTIDNPDSISKFYSMKKYIHILLLTIIVASCSKSKDAVTPPVSTAPKITVQSAKLTDHSGAILLDVSLTFEHPENVSSAQLVVYKTDASGVNFKYAIILKDGSQVVSCPDYTTTSPMEYQIKYTMKSGSVSFTDIAYQTYN